MALTYTDAPDIVSGEAGPWYHHVRLVMRDGRRNVRHRQHRAHDAVAPDVRCRHVGLRPGNGTAPRRPQRRRRSGDNNNVRTDQLIEVPSTTDLSAVTVGFYHRSGTDMGLVVHEKPPSPTAGVGRSSVGDIDYRIKHGDATLGWRGDRHVPHAVTGHYEVGARTAGNQYMLLAIVL